MCKALGFSPANPVLHKPCVVADACNPNSGREEGGPEIQGQPPSEDESYLRSEMMGGGGGGGWGGEQQEALGELSSSAPLTSGVHASGP